MKTTREIYNFCTKVLKQQKSFLIVAFTVFYSLTATAVTNENTPAGSVSFVIGKSYLTNASLNRNNIRITSNTPIFEGDQITTSSSGHVHIRFIDNAMVSIRPNSSMSIEHYQYDSSSPKDSVIRFELSKGVARSISGKGAKAARDKFRLNTPIAAIGVRGTDFVISAKENLIQAVVNEGAIVVAPFSTHCSSNGFGPCETNSVELDSISKHLIEFNTQSNKPILIPLRNKFIPELMLEQKAQNTNNIQDAESKSSLSTESDKSSSDSNENTDDKEPSLDTPLSSKEVSDEETTDSNIDNESEHEAVSNKSTTDEVSTDEVSTNEVSTNEVSTRKEQADKLDNQKNDEDKLSNIPQFEKNDGINSKLSDQTENEIEELLEEASSVEPKPVEPKPDNFVPTEPIALDELQTRQLVWGRWNNTITEEDRIITYRTDAANGRSATVGTDKYVLYRSDSNSITQTTDSTLGDVKFDLVDAQATINTANGTELVEVKDGWLNINFSKSTFDTGLLLNHDSTSNTSLEASGSISDKGFFNSRETDTKIIGASALDGSEASYLFFKETQSGEIEGVTFWDNKP